MRCDEAMREMTLPGDDRDDPGLAQHLAECQACARWAGHASRFNSLWDATRPADPSNETWDRLWSSVAERLDHPFATAGDAAAPHQAPATRSWRGLAAFGLVGLAQAAALFLAVNLFWNTTGKNVQPLGKALNPDVAQQTAPSLDSVVDLEWGQVVLIRSQGPEEVDITDLTLLESANGEDPWYEIFNRFESASTDVAMTE